MNTKKQILLPGLNQQLEFLTKNYNALPVSVLVIGAASEPVAIALSEKYKIQVQLIVEDYESLMTSKLLVDGKNTDVKMMSFEATDFTEKYFDLIYAQASISSTNRNKIIKEIKKILKPGGYLCAGEVVSLKKDVPRFMQDIYDSSGLLPLYTEELVKYYSDRNFSVEAEKDLSYTLKEFYSFNVDKLADAKEKLFDNEKSYYKKLLNKISHESKVYLKLGGDKHMGFKVLLLKKEEK